ncbi:hypothetical protein VOLCADRAFT_118198 [Volvox carteri f. nagariensis]|uniref:Uncharacterized protein n=1 Tax=Volvox carteri f. nagariensis TaxID=3068 RepID=D8U2P9_VOLCA|nr:uncharacterized protein VOLCADRAFT_118198 [Volvox carteri f. nagariensis]EFJ45937.1 hypothetical protein VOLCADRAFT_118198 [Volvox carteri f. nagariensis]|eukprot:XP_002953015.1 hypothetical protein VOLCADRAFT_118198 [Volvox carteri f. nagariensis]
MATNENQLDVLLQAVEEVVEQPEDLEGCEKLIEGSSLKNNFLRIGQALVTINDRKLYKRAGSSSFTQYIEQKSDFGFGPRQALRLLAATRLVRNFPPTIALPTSERQVRALVGLEQQQAVKVWVKANLIAQETGVPLTHRLVESVLGKELPASYRQAARDWQDYVSPDSEYYATPPYILTAVRKLYGGAIDLDPASDEKANEAVQAAKFYTAEEDGLSPELPWSGKIFINPPSGIVGSEPLQGLFFNRAIREAAVAPTITECVILLKAAVGQRWFGPVFDHPHCWLAERTVKKGAAAAAAAAGGGGNGGDGGGGKGPRGMVVVYVGRRVQDFCNAFGELGHIPGLNTWAGSKSAGRD